MTDIPLDQVHYRVISPSFDEDLDVDDDPGAFVTRIPLEVWHLDVLVAKVEALLFHVASAAENGISIFEVFDCVDQEVHELYCAIFDDETDLFRDEVVAAPAGMDVLYIHSVKVIPSHRGKKIGLRAVQRVRHSFARGCGVVALKSHPLVPDPPYEDEIDHQVFAEPFAADGDDAKAKLRDYWSELGFQRVGTTDYMTFDMTLTPQLVGSQRGPWSAETNE